MQNSTAKTANMEPGLKELFNDPITRLAVESSGMNMENVLKLYSDTRVQIQRLREAFRPLKSAFVTITSYTSRPGLSILELNRWSPLCVKH